MDRVYIVNDKETGTDSLVQASTSAQAVQAVVGDRFDARVATALETAKMVAAGAVLIEAPKKAPKEPTLGAPAGAMNGSDVIPPPKGSAVVAAAQAEAADPSNAPWATSESTDTSAKPANLHIGPNA